MTFLGEPPTTPRVRALYDGDVDSRGYVMDLSRAWAHHPEAHDALFGLIAAVAVEGGLSMRERAILVAACASTLGDSYCSLAWGTRLAEESDPAIAAAVLTGSDDGLDDAERAMARWARQVARDPNATTRADVDALREAGLDDGRVFAVTTFVALRLAFSIVNDALGAVPDEELRAGAPPEVRDAVTWGRQRSQPSPPA
ncbi:hypothetical protein [Nocardioides sp. YIM 152315]|uniref:carboxymuconolactone decarboxylase family protein n=1 Tax=Nocardioides sp. YIM 152315 TaxID=3031760 RepID=UPI0023DB7955|nr:hypothetical protein [Nocardioides sp. YIM 152315]MDF1605094.1 hypothetical protein [Nocardioides sp. YIM 152315]